MVRRVPSNAMRPQSAELAEQPVTTSSDRKSVADTSGRPSLGTAAGQRLPVPRRERKPAMAALAVLLIVGGALVSAYLVMASSQRVPVISVAQPVAAGQQIPAVRAAGGAGLVDGRPRLHPVGRPRQGDPDLRDRDARERRAAHQRHDRHRRVGGQGHRRGRSRAQAGPAAGRRAPAGRPRRAVRRRLPGRPERHAERLRPRPGRDRLRRRAARCQRRPERPDRDLGDRPGRPGARR